MHAGPTPAAAPNPRLPVRAEDYFHIGHQVAKRFRRWAEEAGVPLADLEQEAALAVVLAAPGYNPDLGMPSTFFTAAAKNALKNALRARRHRRFRLFPVDPDGEQLEPPAPPEPDRAVAEEVDALLGSLPARQRELIVAHFGLGGQPRKTCKELGQQLGVSRARAWALIAKALRGLREVAVERYGPDAAGVLTEVGAGAGRRAGDWSVG